MNIQIKHDKNRKKARTHQFGGHKMNHKDKLYHMAEVAKRLKKEESLVKKLEPRERPRTGK